MKFYVIISLRRKSIDFSYYQDDGDTQRYAQFDGNWPAPLAIFSHGTEIEIGEGARASAAQQIEGAYDDIFALAQTTGTFDYNGNRLPYNKLLFHAIEYYLRQFLRTTLFGQMGDLDSNRADMNLNFIFGPDLGVNERSYVRKLFKDGGYNRMRELDFNAVLVKALRQESDRPYILVVNSDGADLYLSLYDKTAAAPLHNKILCLPGKGKDPRVERAMEKIIADIREDENAWYPDIEGSMDIIETAARDFLASDRHTLTDSIHLRDGQSMSYYLARQVIESAAGQGCNLGKLVNEVLAPLSVDPSKTTVLLKGQHTVNEYFRSQFRSMFGQVIEPSPLNKARIDTEMVTALLSHDSDPCTFPVPEPPVAPAPRPRPELLRMVKRVLADINGIIRSTSPDLKRGTDKANELLKILNAEGIHDLDSQITDALAELQRVCAHQSVEMPPHKETPGPSAPEVDKTALIKQYRTEIAEAKAVCRNGDPAGGQKALRKIQKELATHGITELDDRLKGALDDCMEKLSRKKTVSPTGEVPATKPAQQAKKASESPASPQKVPAKPASKGQKLLSDGKFAEAKKEFAREGNSDMAALCTSLIRATRDLAGYTAQVDKALPSTAKAILARLKAIRADFLKGGLPVHDVDSLIMRYKQKIK